MKRYILSPEAQQDLREIEAYYLKNVNARIARKVLREITNALRFLAATPGAGHTRGDLTDAPVRFWPVFPYLVVYDSAMQPLGIARVLHARRDLEALLRARPPQATRR